MAVKKTIVCGIYQNANQAEGASAALQAAGFAKDGISVKQQDNQATKAPSGVLLAAHCDTPEQEDRAKDLLKQTGARDISSEDKVEQVFVES
jgi:hypothetical protein